MSNDMATTGFAPMYGQFVLNLPAGFSPHDFSVYWDYIHRFCADIDVAVTGGHTGFVEGQNSTIAGGGTLISIAPRNEVLVSSGAQAGDAVLEIGRASCRERGEIAGGGRAWEGSNERSTR